MAADLGHLLLGQFGVDQIELLLFSLHPHGHGFNDLLGPPAALGVGVGGSPPEGVQGRLADAVMETNKKSKAIETFLASQAEEIDIQVKNVAIEDLRIDGKRIMVSDGHCSGKPKFEGFSLSITLPDEAKAERVFAALCDGGQVRMPLSTTFFSPKFGMLADKFGVPWMIYVVPQA